VLYKTYDLQRGMLDGLGRALEASAAVLTRMPEPVVSSYPMRTALAANRVGRALRLTHDRPDFGVTSVMSGGADADVHEEVVAKTPFGSLVHFVKSSAPGSRPQPKVLIVPGLAGHFATLVRGTVSTMLADHDVYVADWHNARDVPLAAGRFGLDEYIEHLISFLEEIGPGAHLLSVCQPAVASIVAASIMAEDNNQAAPDSLVLLAGPVDTRINPSKVSRFAQRQSISLLERTMLHTVPKRLPGAGRRVYPGFVQVGGFMSMDPGRHVRAFRGAFRNLRKGEADAAKKTLAFYEEYFAVLDIAGEFYLETAQRVFKDNDLPRGQFTWKGRRVDPSRIKSALLTIEGGLDEMCTPGQTEAAHLLCTGIPAERRKHLLQEGVGHYGVFAGSAFENKIYPVIRDFMASASSARDGSRSRQ
jgi:polyhydroxyalkanoate depolymerase